MPIAISPVDREAIHPLRELYRQELACQIVHDCAHNRDGCVEWQLLQIDGETAGYGAVWIGASWMTRGSLFEFYALPKFRTCLFPLFEKLLAATNPSRIYAQTNDPFLGVLIYDYVTTIEAGHILFEDRHRTHHHVEGLKLRLALPEDKNRIFEHKSEPVGEWLLEFGGQVIATGGIGCDYNPSYGDIFMEVHPDFRRRGFGSYLVQELKAICYDTGYVPAARCHYTNLASRATLERVGFSPCARLIRGDVRPTA